MEGMMFFVWDAVEPAKYVESTASQNIDGFERFYHVLKHGHSHKIIGKIEEIA